MTYILEHEEEIKRRIQDKFPDCEFTFESLGNNSLFVTAKGAQFTVRKVFDGPDEKAFQKFLGDLNGYLNVDEDVTSQVSGPKL